MDDTREAQERTFLNLLGTAARPSNLSVPICSRMERRLALYEFYSCGRVSSVIRAEKKPRRNTFPSVEMAPLPLSSSSSSSLLPVTVAAATATAYASAVSHSRRFFFVSCKFQASSSFRPRPEPRVVLTREQGKNGKLIDALFIQSPLLKWRSHTRGARGTVKVVIDGMVLREASTNDAAVVGSTIINPTSKYGIPCLEFPLIEHTEGPDLSRLATVLSGSEVNSKRKWESSFPELSGQAPKIDVYQRKAAGTPNVRVGVVGAGTASIFEEAMRSSQRSLDIAFSPSKATGKVLASELPWFGNGTSTVLYPASAKASNEIGEHAAAVPLYSEEGLSDRGFEVTRLNTYSTVPVCNVDQTLLKEALSAQVLAVASPSAVRSNNC
ncbi:hypothetical protein ACLOJK_016481 [Asimina triloba]